MAKILCIDDNAHGLSARRVLLEKLGHQVTVARSGAEGLQAFRRAKADLVIVDYVMPQMNGSEVVRKLKKSAPRLPVILLSGYTETLNLETKVKDADCILSKGRREIPLERSRSFFGADGWVRLGPPRDSRRGLDSSGSPGGS